jgi:glutathione synthase/RimK-type ligase-like ATP-grasp enzyme
MEPERLPEVRHGTPDERDRGPALHEMLLAWVDAAPCRVANRTRPMASNASKPYQAQLIAECGFAVLETLVTNVPAEVTAFEARQGDLVYKSTSGQRSVGRALDGTARDRLSRVRSLPVQFQRRARGVDLRVHVVGDTVLAAEAETTAVDYRYAASEGETGKVADPRTVLVTGGGFTPVPG